METEDHEGNGGGLWRQIRCMRKGHEGRTETQSCKGEQDKRYDVYLDFSKAFECVAYQRLSKMIKAPGIDGEIYSEIEAWFDCGEQKSSN